MKFPNIEAERARLGLSKTEFAQQLGVTAKTYYNWIGGINPIPSERLIIMSHVCHTSIGYLLGLESYKKII